MVVPLIYTNVFLISLQGHLSRIQIMSEIGYGISLASLILAVLIMLVSRYVTGVSGDIHVLLGSVVQN